MLLTNSNKNATLGAGYYTSVHAGTDITSEIASITYIHHVHSTTIAGGINEESNSADKSSVTQMPETQTTSGGCYTVSAAKQCPGWVYTNVQEMTGHGLDWVGYCSTCGWRDANQQHGDVTKCRNVIGSGYTVSCGHENGDLIEAIIKY